MPRPVRLAAKARARPLPIVAVAVAVLIVLTGVVVGLRGPDGSGGIRTPAASSTSAQGDGAADGAAGAGGAGGAWEPTTPNPDVAAPVDPRAALTPVSVEVPSIGVRSDLLSLAVDATGVMIPPEPYDVAGWFTGGPVPGDIGPAIIAGHVDSRAGPGVFFRLEEMQPGAKIMVTRSDGSVASFTARRVDSYPKAEFPTERVYGPTPGHELRLITCGGDFDRSRRSYVDNIVVYAVLDGSTT